MRDLATGVGDAATGGRIVVVDDSPDFLRMLTRMLQRAGLEVLPFPSATEALGALERSADAVDAVVCDRQMPGMDGIAMLVHVRERWPDLPFIVLTGGASGESAMDAMRHGAHDYLSKPFDAPGEIARVVKRAIELRRLAAGADPAADPAATFPGIVGGSPAMRAVFDQIGSVAATDATVLLLGETGTGKEVLARAIAARSERRAGPFVALNCASLPDSLLESELFGHVRGAFTGATASRPGLFEEASGGTLFLDEIGDISPMTQVRLLRVLQEGEIRPVGASEARKVDVRVIAATHRDLVAGVEDGTFREDLYYRLNVFTIRVPPLRQRLDDLPALVQHLAAKYVALHGRPPVAIDPVAAMLLSTHSWPGNIRELENVVQRAVLSTSGTITAVAVHRAMAGASEVRAAVPTASGTVLPSRAAVPTASGTVLPSRAAAPVGDGSVAREATAALRFGEARAQALEDFARKYLEDVLRQADGVIPAAARIADVEISNFRRLLRRYHVTPTAKVR